MSIDYREIGKRIARRRKSLGLKQTQVCEMCDLSDKYLSGIECARSIPSLEVLMRICRALNTTPDALLLGTAGSTQEDIQYAIYQKTSDLDMSDLEFILAFIDWYREHKNDQKK